MLTPAATDPNRANELVRRAKDPGAFSASHKAVKDAATRADANKAGQK